MASGDESRHRVTIMTPIQSILSMASECCNEDLLKLYYPQFKEHRLFTAEDVIYSEPYMGKEDLNVMIGHRRRILNAAHEIQRLSQAAIAARTATEKCCHGEYSPFVPSLLNA